MAATYDRLPPCGDCNAEDGRAAAGDTLVPMAELELRGTAPVIGGGPLDGASASTRGIRLGGLLSVYVGPNPVLFDNDVDLRAELIHGTEAYRLERAVVVDEEGIEARLVWRYLPRRTGSTPRP